MSNDEGTHTPMSESTPARRHVWKEIAPGIEITHPSPTVTMVMMRHPPMDDIAAMRMWGTGLIDALLAGAVRPPTSP